MTKKIRISGHYRLRFRSGYRSIDKTRIGLNAIGNYYKCKIIHVSRINLLQTIDQSFLDKMLVTYS